MVLQTVQPAAAVLDTVLVPAVQKALAVVTVQFTLENTMPVLPPTMQKVRSRSTKTTVPAARVALPARSVTR